MQSGLGSHIRDMKLPLRNVILGLQQFWDSVCLTLTVSNDVSKIRRYKNWGTVLLPPNPSMLQVCFLELCMVYPNKRRWWFLVSPLQKYSQLCPALINWDKWIEWSITNQIHCCFLFNSAKTMSARTGYARAPTHSGLGHVCGWHTQMTFSDFGVTIIRRQRCPAHPNMWCRVGFLILFTIYPKSRRRLDEWERNKRWTTH